MPSGSCRYISQTPCWRVTLYCTLRGWIKGTKCALFSIKCKGAVWIKKHNYEVNLLLFLLNSTFQKVTIAFLHTSITLDSCYECSRALNSNDNLCFYASSASRCILTLVKQPHLPDHKFYYHAGANGCAIKPIKAKASSHRPYYVALGYSTLRRLKHIHSPIACSILRDKEPIAQLRYWLNSYSKYNIPPKALPLLVCTKNIALRDVS